MADPGSVRIATTVTDRQGRPVSGLTAKDFEVKEDGVVQKIDAVEPRQPETRRIAILLDEFHVDPADTAAVREAITRFVDNRLREGDMAVVMKPLDPLSSIRLTTDRDELRRTIATFEGRKGQYQPRTPLEAETMGSAPSLVEAGRAQVILSALRALTAQLGTVSGRSAILIVTEGFASQARRSSARGLPDAGIVERFANRYDVPIYAFDPRVTHDENEPGAAVLAKLVSETGGTLSRGPDLATNVARAATELDGGYTLVYTSAHGDDGRYHPVQVTIQKVQADARARAGYVSAPSPEMRRALRALSTDAAPSAPPRMLKRSSLVQVWSGVTQMNASGGASVAVTWEPGAASGSGLGRSPAARVTLKATTPDGKVLFDGTLAPARSGGAGDGDRAEFVAPTGRVLLDMTVLSLAGIKLDTDSRDLEIPAVKTDSPLLLPPVLIATQSAREFRDLSASAEAAPAPTREFRRTERLIIRVPAYASSGAIQVTAQLLNRVGQTMRVLETMPNEATGVAQFDLPLAPLAPGEYFLQFTVQGPHGPISQRVGFKITG
jgi:VWFA-related protein